MSNYQIIFVFKHELLNKPLRRLLKDDAIPTIFDYNKDKVVHKRKSSTRGEIQNKKQLCDNTFERYSQWETLEKEQNTVGLQTELVVTRNIDTQTCISQSSFTREVGTQFNWFDEISPLEDQENKCIDAFEELSGDDDVSYHDSDTDYVPTESDESEEDCENFSVNQS